MFRLEKCSVLYYNVIWREVYTEGVVFKAMATWIVHLRIADIFIKSNTVPNEFKREFILGSISPDCGYGKKDSCGEFMPPPEVTHWAPGGIKVHCEYKKFFSEYLMRKERNSDYYFYLGYYVHLITDIIWSATIYLPTQTEYADEYKKDPEFLKIIKKDWYDLDFKFLFSNPEFEPYKILKNNSTVKDYLPYYEPHQLTVQTKFIADYYSAMPEHDIDREYTYLDEHKMSSFIECATEIIDIDLKRKQLI